MQDVNDDMDELLRRAANNYFLNTNSADWDKISGALRTGENTGNSTPESKVRSRNEKGNRFFSYFTFYISPFEIAKERKKYSNLLLLVMLLGLPLISVDYFVINNRLYTMEIAKIDESATQNKATYNPEKTNSRNSNEKKSVYIKKLNSNSYYTRAYANEPRDNNRTTIENERHDFVTNNKMISKKTFNLTNENSSDFTSRNRIESKPIIISDHGKDHSINKISDSIADIPTGNNDSKNIADTNANKKIEDSNKKHNKPLFYAGILAGPDVSTVKFQTVNRTGFSAGLIAGYSLSKNLTIETGLLIDKKFYYTEGKYLNPKYFSIPSFINIDDVDGSCSMIEWPVNLYYTIKSFRRNFITANAGISSYFMKNEKYSYTFQRNGVENEWNLAYKNSSNNLFSVANIGVSYNHDLSKSLLMRIQPYLKIPVNGIGMGRLPITSSGVYIILSKKIR